MPKGRDPKISLYLLISIVDIKKVYNFGQLQNEGVKNLPICQHLALKKYLLFYKSNENVGFDCNSKKLHPKREIHLVLKN